MEPTSLLLLLSLGWTCSGRLIMLPLQPIVEIGGSIQLNCSLDCLDGKVQWKGLDTNLGNVISTPTYTLLLVTNAAIAMEGMKICVGSCQGESLQEWTNLQVYSLPDTLQLETQPKELVAGEPARLRCSVRQVYPPGSLTLSWYRGDQRLESPEPEEAADDEELFSYDSALEVPGEKVTEGAEFRCEAELLLPSERRFHRGTAVTVSTRAVAEEPTSEPVTGQENPTTQSPATTASPAPDRSPTTEPGATTASPAPDRSPTTEPGATTASPAPDPTPTRELGATTASPAPDRSPTTELGATTASPAPDPTPTRELGATTASPAPDPTPTTELGATTASTTAAPTPAASPAAELTVTSHKPSAKATSVHWLATTETLAPESGAASLHPSMGAATTDWSPSGGLSSATESPTAGDVTSPESPRTESVCNLLIRPVPPEGTTGEALKIICEAECREEVTIRWLRTPVALDRYQEEASQGKSTLTVDRVGLYHQGIYECVLLSRRPKLASLHVTVSSATFSTDSAIAVGTAGSFLGLIVTAFASRRLWRRLHPPGMTGPKGNSV